MQNIKYALLLFLFVGSTSTFAQKIFIGNEETNRKLTWSDFTGPADRGSSHHALTTWYLDYSIDDIRVYGDSVHIGKMIANIKMVPEESWFIRDKATDELLVHEQGHFNIGKLCMKEFLSIYTQTSFRKNDFNEKLKKIFSDVMNKYFALSDQYDRETEHSMNKEAQALWNTFFEKYL